ncbi:hypothetical protein [Chryseobacterium sp.]|uniref:hypothetical protein n=1 Tax=Chryseobacterium sp. TaxID=1871047 RepID=UPI0025BE9BB1|nr:hypothetical protein [Chryseobacterium sp.]
MKNLNEKLAQFSIEKLEERKEFTFYCNPKPGCHPKPTPPDGNNNQGTDPGNGGGVIN